MFSYCRVVFVADVTAAADLKHRGTEVTESARIKELRVLCASVFHPDPGRNFYSSRTDRTATAGLVRVFVGKCC